MRIALCFWGLCRSTHLTIESIEECIYKPLKEAGYDVTTFLHTYTLYRNYKNSRSNELNIQLKNTNYKLLKPDNYKTENQDQIDIQLDFIKYRTMGDPWEHDTISVSDKWETLNNHIRALWSLQKVTELWTTCGQSFDVVLYLRPDVSYKTKLKKEWIEAVHRGTVFIPDFHLYFGSNDRFAIGHPEDMKLYGNRLNEALSYSQRKPLHAEAFLTDFMRSKGVQFVTIPFRFQRVRANGLVCESDRGLF